MQHCLYIHGFNSSGSSHKSNLLARHIQRYQLDIILHSPDLASTPSRAYAQLQQILADLGDCKPALVGSSMGGFFATCLAEQFNLRALLINPVVQPARLFTALMGPQHNPYTDEHYVLGEQHRQEVTELTPTHLTRPGNYQVLLGQQDETLDYRDALDYYKQSEIVLIPEGDHQLPVFEDYIEQGLTFLFPE